MSETKLWNKIDQILWQEWDPIGVNEFGDDARDEYYGYIPEIEKLVRERASVEQVANYLHIIATVNMGLMGNIEHRQYIASKLVDLTRTDSA